MAENTEIVKTEDENNLSVLNSVADILDTAIEDEYQANRNTSPLSMIISSVQTMTLQKLPEAISSLGTSVLSVAVRNSLGEWSNYYAKSISVIPIMIDTHKAPNGKVVYPRGARPYTSDGKRDLSGEESYACRSYDGINPISDYVGREVLDFRTGELVTIQQTEEGFCLKCPLASFNPSNKLSKPTKPICDQMPRAFVYVLPATVHTEKDGELVEVEINGGLGVLNAPNASTRVTLMGGKIGQEHVNGLKKMLQQSGTKVVTFTKEEWEEISPLLPDNAKAAYKVLDDGSAQGVVPVTPIYPNGVPTYIGTAENAVRVVEVASTAVKWSATFSGRGYKFTLKEDGWASEEDYSAAMQAMVSYQDYVSEIKRSIATQLERGEEKQLPEPKEEKNEQTSSLDDGLEL